MQDNPSSSLHYKCIEAVSGSLFNYSNTISIVLLQNTQMPTTSTVLLQNTQNLTTFIELFQNTLNLTTSIELLQNTQKSTTSKYSKPKT